MPTEREMFWDADTFAVITDQTKPAMKWTIAELIKRGKNVYTVDLSDNPDEGAMHKVSELPEGVERAVIGVTRTQPAEVMDMLEKKGIIDMWIHMMTETPETKEKCSDAQLNCIAGKCPMMYLGHGLSIHGVHRGIAKLIHKY